MAFPTSTPYLLFAPPHGAATYTALAPGHLRLLLADLHSQPSLELDMVTIHLSSDYDNISTSGVLQFAEELRKKYGIRVSGTDVSLLKCCVRIYGG